MKSYIIQYSIPKNNKIAVSDWQEYTKTVRAHSDKEAIAKFNKNRNGTWLILDCWEIE